MSERKNEAVWMEKQQTWRIRLQRDGEKKVFYSSKPGRKGKLEAERKADAWLRSGAEKENVRFRALAEAYLDSIDTGHSTAHRDREESVIKVWLLPRWEFRKVSALTNRDYQLAINAPAEATPPRSYRTCTHVRATISGIWRYAHSDRITMEQPFGLKIPKSAPKGERHIFQPDDIKRLFSPEFDHYLHIDAFRFAALTGVRRGELCGLREEDYQNGVITIRRSITPAGQIAAPKTANSVRTFVCTSEAKKAVLRQIRRNESLPAKSSWLFPNANGERMLPTTLYKSWRKFCKANGFPAISLHELRHTMVSMAKVNVPLPLLKMIVGHADNMDTIGVYGHDLAGDMDAAAAALDASQKKILG